MIRCRRCKREYNPRPWEEDSNWNICPECERELNEEAMPKCDLCGEPTLGGTYCVTCESYIGDVMNRAIGELAERVDHKKKRDMAIDAINDWVSRHW